MPNNTINKFYEKENISKKKNIIKNNSFVNSFPKSFDIIHSVLNKNKLNDKVKNDYREKNQKIKSYNNRFRYELKTEDEKNPIHNAEIINNTNNKIKKNNQLNSSNKNIKNSKKIFDSAHIELIKNFSTEIIKKVNNCSNNDYSTNASINQINQNNHNTDVKLISINPSHFQNHKEYSNLNNQITNCSNHKDFNLENHEKSLFKSKSTQNYSTAIVKKTNKNTEIYERCKKWKENNIKYKTKMKEENDKENSKSCNFSPLITKIIKRDYDAKFIKNESKFIDNYLKRRRTFLKMEEEQKNFKKKIFGKSFENFSSIKITQPKEFNFGRSRSRKSKDMKNNPINIHKPQIVNEYRKEFNTINFFNQTVVEYEMTLLNFREGKPSNYIFSKIINNNKLNYSFNLQKRNKLEKNRKSFNDNLKMNKNIIKIPINSHDNKINKNLNIKKEKNTYFGESNLEDIDENLNQEDSRTDTKTKCHEQNIVNSNPAEEFDDQIENNIDQKLNNKNMIIKLI